MKYRWLCGNGHLTTFNGITDEPNPYNWNCGHCGGTQVWAEALEVGQIGTQLLEINEGKSMAIYKIPATTLILEIGKWYKRKDSAYKCVGVNGQGEYPAILQTESGYLEAVKLNGETAKGIPFKPCNPPHDCKHNMIITTAGTDIQKGKAVIQVMAHCSCGKSWKGTTHIKEIK